MRTALKAGKYSFQRLTALFLLLLIHLLFTHKYISRISSLAWLADSAYALLYSGIALWFINRPSFLRWKWLLPLLLTALVGAQLFLFHKIPQQSLNVDRWSVISSFWDTALRGAYPYTARSTMNNMPGPSPFYFILAFPFYLTGELGYLSLCGLMLFVLLAFYYFREKSLSASAIILVLISLPVQYEVITRSTVFFNSVIFLAYMLACFGVKQWKPGKVLLAGIIGGLLLSTRSVMILPLIFLYVYLLKYNAGWKSIWMLGTGTVFGFGCLFIPLYFWDSRLFMEYNPITLQKSFLPNSMLAILLLSATGWSFLTKSRQQVIFGSGVMLFAAIAFYVLYQWHINHYGDVLFSSAADISYFALSIPFLVLSVVQNNTSLKG